MEEARINDIRIGEIGEARINSIKIGEIVGCDNPPYGCNITRSPCQPFGTYKSVGILLEN